MVTEFNGSGQTERLRVGVIASRYNEFITARLLSGALNALRERGVPDANVTVAWVPGALELPQAAQRMAETREWDALIVLGCVIRGETHHFNVVADGAARGVDQAARAAGAAGVPIAFGVLTVDNAEQAVARAGGALGNRGADAANAAVDMANLFHKLPPMQQRQA